MMKYYEKENYPPTDIRYYTELVERMGILGFITTILLVLLLVIIKFISVGFSLSAFVQALADPALSDLIRSVILVWLIVALSPDLIEYFIGKFTNWNYDLEGGHKLVAAVMLIMLLLIGYAAYVVMGIISGMGGMLTLSVYAAVLYGLKKSFEALQA